MLWLTKYKSDIRIRSSDGIFLTIFRIFTEFSIVPHFIDVLVFLLSVAISVTLT